MGSMLTGRCPCGFETDMLFVGVGMRDMFVDRNTVIYFCDACQIVDTRDLNRNTIDSWSKGEEDLGMKKYIKCRKCRKRVQYYGEIREDKDDLESWTLSYEQQVILPSNPHHCPGCKEDRLTFYQTGLWD
mgnify:CR=1 FL=1